MTAAQEVECEDAQEVDEELGWFDGVRAELEGVIKAELEPEDRHEGHQQEARYGQVEHVTSASFTSHERIRSTMECRTMES